MLFQQLDIQNFGSIGELKLPLSKQGLTLVLGKNKDALKADSNASGKSMLLDALTWVLWGSTVRGFSTDDIVHNKVNKNCKVTITFSDKGCDYEVSRYRKNVLDKNIKANDLILKCNGENVCGVSIASTQSMLEEIIGLDFITFCAMMPGAGVNVASMTDAEVKLLLEKLLRTEGLGKASEEARRLHRSSSEEAKEQTIKLESLQVSIEEIKERIIALESKNNNYKDIKVSKLLEVTNNIVVLEAKKTSYDSIIGEESKLQDALKPLSVLIKDAIVRISKQQDNIIKIDTYYGDYCNKLQLEIGTETASWQIAKETVFAVNSLGNFCHVCFQDIDQAHKDSLKKKYVKQELSKRMMKGGLTAKLNNNKSKWAADKEKEQKLYETAVQEYDTYFTEHSEIRTKLEKIEATKTTVILLQDQIDALIAQKVSIEKENNPYSSLLKAEETKLQHKIKEHKKITQLLKELNNKVSILSFWVDSFSPSGIRSFMLEHVTPILNQFAKTYTDFITGGEMDITFHTKDILKSGKSKEKFNIQVKQQEGGTSYASNSSGERARANLVIALALGELAALRADKIIPFRFFDEPFESIDVLGTETIVSLLNQQKDKYDTVFVITHQDNFKEMFSKKITIVKKNGFSYLERE